MKQWDKWLQWHYNRELSNLMSCCWKLSLLVTDPGSNTLMMIWDLLGLMLSTRCLRNVWESNLGQGQDDQGEKKLIEQVQLYLLTSYLLISALMLANSCPTENISACMCIIFKYTLHELSFAFFRLTVTPNSLCCVHHCWQQSIIHCESMVVGGFRGYCP